MMRMLRLGRTRIELHRCNCRPTALKAKPHRRAAAAANRLEDRPGFTSTEPPGRIAPVQFRRGGADSLGSTARARSQSGHEGASCRWRYGRPPRSQDGTRTGWSSAALDRTRSRTQRPRPPFRIVPTPKPELHRCNSMLDLRVEGRRLPWRKTASGALASEQTGALPCAENSKLHRWNSGPWGAIGVTKEMGSAMPRGYNCTGAIPWVALI